MQLENLQLVVNASTMAVNARGPLFNNRLHDIPTCVQEIALQGVHCGAALALAAMQVQTRHDLRTMEPGFLMADDPDMHDDLIEVFDDTVEAIMDIISA